MLHQHFIDIAKESGKKEAIHDFSTNKILTYNRSLIASLLLSRIFGKMDKGFIGIMIPTSAGCVLTKNWNIDEWQDPCDDQLFDRGRTKRQICPAEM